MQDFPWEHLYLVSLHWSLTQFTPAGMDVTPTNEVERGFTIGVVVFALVGFAYVVGSITASLAQLRTMSEEASKDFWQMRRFLNQNSVDHNLAARIQRFCGIHIQSPAEDHVHQPGQSLVPPVQATDGRAAVRHQPATHESASALHVPQ